MTSNKLSSILIGKFFFKSKNATEKVKKQANMKDNICNILQFMHVLKVLKAFVLKVFVFRIYKVEINRNDDIQLKLKMYKILQTSISQ